MTTKTTHFEVLKRIENLKSENNLFQVKVKREGEGENEEETIYFVKENSLFTSRDSNPILSLEKEISCFLLMEMEMEMEMECLDYFICCTGSGSGGGSGAQMIYIYTRNRDIAGLTTMPTLSRSHAVKSGHEAVILCMDARVQGDLFATGSADSIVKVWNRAGAFQTHNLKGHSGIISALSFAKEGYTLASASDDCTVRVWNLAAKNCVAVLESHVSVVREIVFDTEGDYLYSGARDGVFIKWSRKNNYSAVMTVPVYESIESIQLITLDDDENRTVLCTAGETGTVKVWDTLDGTLISTFARPEAANYQFTRTIYKNKTLYALTSDQTLLRLNPSPEASLAMTSSLSAYNEDILQVALMNNDTEILVATNSSLLKCYRIDTTLCSIFYGHTSTIISLAVSPNSSHVASGCKDSTIIVWERITTSSTSASHLEKVCSLLGHTGHVTALAFPTPDTLLSASTDRTVKYWDISTQKSKYTFMAHENDITSCKVAPCGTLFATSSLDKTAKIWHLRDGSLKSTLKGHKRGVWSLNFSPLDQSIVTSSSDKSLKIWGLDGTCIRTFEGHLNAVHDCSFLDTGLQVLSTGADGLLKLWDTRTGEALTFDAHDDRVWSLAVGDGVVVSGSADSSICVWRDTSAQHAQIETQIHEDQVTKENDLGLYMHRKDYKSALILALDLDYSFKTLEILKHIACTEEGGRNAEVDAYLTGLQQTPVLFVRLLGYIQTWTTSPKHTVVVQSVLNHLLATIPGHAWLELGPKGREMLQAIFVYSKRHLERANGMIKDAYLINHLLDRMSVL